MATLVPAGPSKATSPPPDAVETCTVPADGVSSPATRLRSVVFPQPDAPTTHTNSPAATSREMSCNAVALAFPTPFRFDTPLSEPAGAPTEVTVTTSIPEAVHRCATVGSTVRGRRDR